VNDRSRDATPEILNRRASGNPRLKVIHVSELPPGWLGKTHGLQRGYEASSGEWLLFTDADVRFAPDALRRAIRVVLDRQWDHLSLLSRFELKGFWESALMACFAMIGTMLIRPHRVTNPKSRAFAGAGYFNLVRRTAYEASGTHRRLALEVVDDVKLGKIIKRAGFRSGVAMGDDFVTLRWQHGVGNIIRGLEKNGFAGIGFSVPLCVLMLLAAPAIHILPFIAAVFARGWAQVFAGVAAVTAAGMHAAFARYLKCTPLVGVTYPICTLLMTYTLVRSAVLTLRRGGIVWRDTFYSLDQLRKGIV
jgi:glycosyltransferase involved in cell wall biosynthesis